MTTTRIQVIDCVKKWKEKCNRHQSNHEAQLTWVSHIVEYAKYLDNRVKTGGTFLAKEVPLLK